MVQSNRVTQCLNVVFDDAEDDNENRGEKERKEIESEDDDEGSVYSCTVVPVSKKVESETVVNEQTEAVKEEQGVNDEIAQKEEVETDQEKQAEIDDKSKTEESEEVEKPPQKKEKFSLNKAATEFIPNAVVESTEKEEVGMSIFPNPSTPTSSDKVSSELQTLQKFNALPEIEFIGNVVDKQPETVTIADGTALMPDLYGMQQPYLAQMIPAHFFSQIGQLPQNSYIAQIQSPEIIEEINQNAPELLPMLSQQTSNVTMPPIEEDMEFEDMEFEETEQAKDENIAAVSKLNKEAPVFVPTVTVIPTVKKPINRFGEAFAQFSDYTKVFGSDLSSNPFAKSPFDKGSIAEIHGRCPLLKFV